MFTSWYQKIAKIGTGLFLQVLDVRVQKTEDRGRAQRTTFRIINLSSVICFLSSETWHLKPEI